MGSYMTLICNYHRQYQSPRAPNKTHPRRCTVWGDTETLRKRNRFMCSDCRDGQVLTLVMTLPQSGRLDGGEQPQGLPDERAQRLFAATVFIPALDSELLLVAEITAQVPFSTSHRGDRIPSRPEGCAVAMALAPPNCRATAIAAFPLRELTT